MAIANPNVRQFLQSA